MIDVMDSQKVLDTDETILLIEERFGYNENLIECLVMDAYDDARHVYKWAIANGLSDEVAREKASRVLDERLNR